MHDAKLLFDYKAALGCAAIVSGFFFYINPLKNELDTQAYPLILSSLYLAFSDRIEKKSLFIFLYIFSFSIISLLFLVDSGGDIKIGVRGVYNYLSLIVFVMCFKKYFNRYGEPIVFLKHSIFLYVLIGAIQSLLGNDAFSFLINARTTPDRGVTSLTPEPTYFGIVLYLMLMMVEVANGFGEKERTIYRLVLVFSIVFLAKSSMVLVFLLLYLLYQVMRNGGGLKFIGLSFFVVLLSVVVSEYLSDSRIIFLIELLYRNPTALIEIDASINDRVSHIFISIYGFFLNYSLPGWFDSYSYYIGNKYSLSGGVFWFGGNSDKIMSFLGAIIYEMGFLSVVVLWFLNSMFYDKNNKLLYFICILPVLFSAITLSNPLVYLCAVWINYRKENIIVSK